MLEQFSQKINHENNNENKIKLYPKFEKILNYIIMIVNKVIKIQRIQLLRREDLLFFYEEEFNKVLHHFDNWNFLEKNESKIDKEIRENKGAKNIENKIKGNQNLKRLKNINYYNTINKNYIIIAYIIFMIINILYQIKSNILFDSFYFQHLSTIKLKIKGTGTKNLFGNEEGHIFPSIDYLEEVKINGQIKNTKEYQYYFDQTVNTVELKWDENINKCGYMFWKCSDITEIDLSNFKTSQVTQMNAMFAYCSSLTSINLSNLNTLKVLSMNWMFAYCSSLTSLDISNYQTSKVLIMNSMFAGCSLLTSLDLSRFETSRVYNMIYMFQDCSSLTSLDLSNFITSSVTKMSNMFQGCTKLEYINLENFNEIKLNNDSSNYNNMFYNVPENVVVCIQESITKNKIFPQITSKKFYVIDCTSDWKLKQKILINNNQCIHSCGVSTKYKNKNNGKCYNNCIKVSVYENNSKTYKCNCESNECLLCPKTIVACSNNIDFNYYPKENDPFNNDKYINFYKYLEGYYLGNDIYKKCYSTCKTCNIGGNNIDHNCNDCDDNYQMKFQHNNYNNCYEKCSFYYYFDNNNIYHCSEGPSCPNEFSKLIEAQKECIKNNIKNNIENLILDKNEIEQMSNERQIEYYDNLIDIIEKGMTNHDTSEIDNGKDEIIEVGKTTWTITTSENQKRNININVTIIDLGDCEISLRDYYNISETEKKKKKKIDIVQDGMKIPKVEYDVYCKLFGTNLIKLNLTVCENDKILIYMPYELNGNVDELNSGSGYYNDICYTTTSEDGTDISLKDRKKEFIDKNKTVCQDDCKFSDYKSETMKVECSCNAKESSPSIANMNINKNKLLDNFKNIKNIANFNFLICYKKLLKKEGIIHNFGAYIIFAIILFHIISIFVFCIIDYPLIKKKIKQIIFRINKPKIFNKIVNRKNKKKKKGSNIISIYRKGNRLSNKINFKNIIPKNDNNKRNIIPKIIRNNQSIKRKTNTKFDYIDEEINEFSYNLAIKLDKRNYCQYYISLLKTKHSLFFALCNNNDYNSRIIKIDLFLIGFTIDYTVNALFFNDDTMHKIYQNKGKFDLESQLLIIICSTLISMVLNAPLNYLSLSNDAIIAFKQYKSKINILKMSKLLENRLKIKFSFYFIIGFLLLSFFWYYISMFCVIYKNTQLHLLKDTLISFGFSLIIPFGIYLFPGIFRIPALSNRKSKKACLYNFSKFLQLF